jgi:hypothetical protein
VNGVGATWRALLLAWLGTFLGFLVVANGNLENTDSALTMHAARVLWQRGDSGLLRADQGGELLGERLGADYIAATRDCGKVGANGRAYVWFPVGHVWLLAPFAALGDALERAFPEVERRWREVTAPGADEEHLRYSVSYVHGHPVLTQGLIAVLVPPFFAATSVLLLFLIARALGASGRDAFLGTLGIAAGTQFAALGRETLSDSPGLCLLLAALLATVRHSRQPLRATWLVAGGAAAGAAVLLRYQNAFLVLALAAAIFVADRRRRPLAGLAWFGLGGLPFLAALVAVNTARFGNPFDTGYPAVEAWFDQPLHAGLGKLFFAAGRGVMWFSPLLWLALPFACRKAAVPQHRWLAWVMFGAPFLLFATARGWQGGQCWGARYVTPGVIVLLALVLPQARPWASWPRLWTVLLGAGMFVNLTGVVAPVRGQIQLATQAVQAEAAHEVAAGRMTEAEAKTIDPADPLSWRPRFSPLHSNWSYAAHSRRGGFEDENGAPRHGSANTIEPLFGIAAAEPRHGDAPWRWEDRCGRHLWWRFWSDLLQVPGWLLVLPVFVGAVAASAAGWRLLRAG